MAPPKTQLSAAEQLRKLAARFGVHDQYPADVQREAQAWADAPRIDDPSLLDLTALPFVTIDNESSRDLDQAMHICRQGSGLLLRYALADASFYVQPGSALFDEALRRGASYYMPHMAFPMLPRVLSEGVVSLNAGCDRRALLVAMELDADGACTRTTIERARIRSAAKLTYAGVQALYDAGTTGPLAGRPFTETLELLREVGLLRLAAARARNVVQYHRAEVEVSLGDHGVGFEVVGDARLDVERYNEQVSLLCNVEGAAILAGASGEGVYRVHPSPPPERIEELESLSAAVAREHSLDPTVWAWDRAREPLADFLERLPTSGRPGRVHRAIERQAMMANVRSSFAAAPGGHHGIGASSYARFSSPMREIVGVFTHKEVLEHLGRREPGLTHEDLALREQVVEAGNRSKDLQRQLTRQANELVLNHVLSGDAIAKGRAEGARVGTILGLRPTRVYVQLDDPPIDVKVYVRDLAPGYRLADDGAAMSREGQAGARLRLGDRVEVRTRGYDKRRRRWRLDIRPA